MAVDASMLRRSKVWEKTNDTPPRLIYIPPEQRHNFQLGLASAPVPRRVQRSRAKGWKNPEHTICVARPTIFGNPFVTGPGRDAVKLYRQWLNNDLSPTELLILLNYERRKPFDKFNLLDQLHAQQSAVLRQLPNLRGWNLSCWCALNNPCHADVLLEMANK